MITKLPPWIEKGAWTMAFIAGMVNAVGLLGFKHQAVTHLTGTTSLLAAAWAFQDGTSAGHYTAIIGSFLTGSMISGFLIQDRTLQLGRRYGIALLLEAMLLAVAVPLLNRNSLFGIYFASCSCGLQNAMVSTYSGTLLRTTHMTGMFTDLGIFLGHYLRGLPVNLRRLRLCLLIIFGFLSGGMMGAFVFQYWKYATLYLPAALTACASFVYGWYWFRMRNADGSGLDGRRSPQ